jgi:hypothetical protein
MPEEARNGARKKGERERRKGHEFPYIFVVSHHGYIDCGHE